jgi:hypothetical protein
MTPCNALSDRMPDVALGRLRWTAAEEQHLAGCAECQAEWTIVAAASRLRTPAGAALDPDRIARGALARLTAERTRGRARARLWKAAGLAAAAAVVLAVWTGRSGPARRGAAAPLAPAPVAVSHPQAPAVPAPRPSAAQSPMELAMPELDSLPVEALDSILNALDEPVARAGDELAGDDGDIELERVLAGLEG